MTVPGLLFKHQLQPFTGQVKGCNWCLYAMPSGGSSMGGFAYSMIQYYIMLLCK